MEQERKKRSLYYVNEEVSLIGQFELLPSPLRVVPQLLPPLHHPLLHLHQAELQARRAEVDGGVGGVQLLLQLLHANIENIEPNL